MGLAPNSQEHCTITVCYYTCTEHTGVTDTLDTYSLWSRVKIMLSSIL